MRIFTCTNHDGFWPVGVASVVVAEDEEHAGLLLDSVLAELGLQVRAESPYTLQEISTGNAMAIVLRDGKY